MLRPAVLSQIVGKMQLQRLAEVLGGNWGLRKHRNHSLLEKVYQLQIVNNPEVLPEVLPEVQPGMLF
ncbi:MAG: hypothetical protein NVSMB28_27590 [Collimonas sp.]